MEQRTIEIEKVKLCNNNPITLFAGLNVLESRDLAKQVCDHLLTVTNELEIPFVFKASFDKANRSSIASFRGPGLEAGMKIFEEIKKEFDVPIITDVHEPYQAEILSEVVDVLQLPAFLSRQTDLVEALARTGKAVNIKKAQFLSPREMIHIIKKFNEAGNDKLILCERGTCFGYNNLVVDMLAFPEMKKFGYPVMFDSTHALQVPGGLTSSAGGRREYAAALTKAGVVQGISSLFLETHPDPSNALCDGPCALPLNLVKKFLYQVKEIDHMIKSQEELKIS